MSPVEHFDLAAVVGARTAAWRRVAFLICGDWATAEDIVQTSVIKLSRSWHRIEPAGLEQYARKVISRVAIDESRRPHRQRERLHEPPDQPDARRPNEDILDVRAALSSLPAQQRAVLVLRFYEDLTIAATADALGVKASTVKSHTARGLDAIRRYTETAAPSIEPDQSKLNRLTRPKVRE